MKRTTLAATLLILSLGLMVASAPPAQARRLPLPLRCQEQTQWCWAACSQSILDYYGTSVEQCSLATWACDWRVWCNPCLDCCTYPAHSNCCNRPNAMYGIYGSILTILRDFGAIHSTGSASVLSQAEVEAEIADNRPFVIRWEWSNGNGHFIVGHGYDDETANLHYMDPWPVNDCDYHIASYAWVKQGGGHTWTHTLKLDAGDTLQVNASGTGEYTTIQAAVNAAEDRDIIELADGTYDVAYHQGGATYGIDFGGKALTLRSASRNPMNCRLDAINGLRGFYLYSGEPLGTVIEGVHIYNGSYGFGAGIGLFDGASPTIRDCILTQNVSPQQGGALCCYEECSPYVIDTRFYENSASGTGGAVWCYSASRPTFAGCTFAGNSGTSGSAIASVGGSGCAISHCTFYGNAASNTGGGAIAYAIGSDPTIANTIVAFSPQGSGVEAPLGGAPDITCTDIYGNAGGDWVGNLAALLGTNGNICQDPRFCCAPAQDFTLNVYSPCTAENAGDCGRIGAHDVGCGWVPNLPDDLSHGVFIAHHPVDLSYSSGSEYCEFYDGEFGIQSCEEQNPQITSPGGRVWYLLAAWIEEKVWSGASFGFTDFDPGSFEFIECGPCFPETGMEIPSGAWPAPEAGVALVSTGAPWAGNFRPLYYFAGYSYAPGSLPLGPNPGDGLAGTVNALDPPEAFPATCLGTLGVLQEGEVCCPSQPPPVELAACCLDGVECLLLPEGECLEMGGVWDAGTTACTPNPCPEYEAACCVDEECFLVTAAECATLGGAWQADVVSCQPNPCRAPLDIAEHDVGACSLSVTAQGTLGYLDGSQSQGVGFVYPPGGESLLFLGGLWVGLSPDYVANHDFDADPAQEWRVTASPDGHLWFEEPGTGDQDLHGCFDDSAAAAPRGLRVHQHSWAYGTPALGEDYVILDYRISCATGAPMESAYVGVFLDYDVTDPYRNTGAVSPGQNLVYLADSTGLHAGLMLLQDESGVPAPSNLTLISNPDYVYPELHVLDADKYAFLAAADPEHVLHATPAPEDYSLLAAAGPFALLPDQEGVRVGFALLGGTSLEELELNAAQAQAAYLGGAQGGLPGLALGPAVTRLLPSRPNPFRTDAQLAFELARPGVVALDVFDVTGRLVRPIVRSRLAAARHRLTWDGRDADGRPLPGGVYFLRLEADGVRACRRLIRVR